MARIVCCGEGMLELTGSGDDWRLGYGGDTLNTAIHLARSGHDVAYLTALGSDPFSRSLRDKWAGEGLDTSWVLDHPTRQPGLYAITTDEQGERSFTYWRETSAAREMFSLTDAAMWRELAEQTELFCFSLISLAILPVRGVTSLLLLADMIRQGGGRVAFDGNYRSRLWEGRTPDDVRATRDAAIGMADIGLPTLDDEALLSGAESADQVAAHWQGLGCAETVVKMGVDGCRLPDGTILAPDVALEPVDTSGAGDAFNAGYLAARLRGADARASAISGHRLAGWTIARAGAIPRADGEAPYG